ncbi:hypothetical protein CF319_g7214 [Tilletia indica]|nr:hypothetical protein CF319_g7214 [Tilletia indica]
MNLLATWPLDGGGLAPLVLREAVLMNSLQESVSEDRFGLPADEDDSESTPAESDDDSNDHDERNPGADEGSEWPDHGPDNNGESFLAALHRIQQEAETGPGNADRPIPEGTDPVDELAAGLDDLLRAAPDGYDAEDEAVDDASLANQRHGPGPTFGPSESDIDVATVEHIGAMLLDDLLGSYHVPPRPTEPPSERVEALSSDTKLSLVFYRRWLATGGTVEAYTEGAETLKEIGHPVISLHLVKVLAASLSELHPVPFDMCLHSCIAYVGAYADKTTCPWTRVVKEKDELGVERKRTFVCGERRYGPDGKPRRQFMYMPLLDRLRVMFRNPELSRLLRYRHERLEALRTARDTPNKWKDFVFSDVTDGIGNLHLADELGLFTAPTDVAISVATDGAQLLSNKDSSVWIITGACLNTPPQLRFRRAHQFVLTIIPGPNPPGDIESFFRPLMEEMARLSRGDWVWDGMDRKWFLLRAYLVGLYADQPGSSKLNKMTGTQGRRGCRFCEIDACYGHSKANPTSDTNDVANRTGPPVNGPQPVPAPSQSGEPPSGARKRKRTVNSTTASATTRADERGGASVSEGPDATSTMTNATGVAPASTSLRPKWGKTPYFPLSTPLDLHLLQPNVSRPSTYDPMALPLRSDDTFRSHITQIQLATSKTERKRVGTRTGVAALPLLAASPAFTHPEFFPLDIFHLFSFNTLQLLWNTMRTRLPGDPTVLDDIRQHRFGEMVVSAGRDLPGSFGKAPRNTNLFHNTHYKMVEWITVFHCYFGPFLHSEGVDPNVIKMLLALLDGMGVAAQSIGCSLADVGYVSASLVSFVRQWEDLFIRGDGNLLSRAR